MASRFLYSPGDAIQIVNESDLVSMGILPIPSFTPDRADAGYNPNRDYHGRFAPGPHHERIRNAVNNTVRQPTAEEESHRAVHGHRPLPPELAAKRQARHELQDAETVRHETAAIAAEHAALTAGHIAPMPTAKLAAYDAAHARIQREAAQRQVHLDEHQGNSAHALGRLEAASDTEAKIGGHDVNNPIDSHEVASMHLGAVAGRPESSVTSYEAHHSVAAHGSIGEHPGADHPRARDYEQAHAARSAAYQRRAEEAQAALEALHGHQVRAVAETKQAMRDHSDAARAMLRESDRYEHSGVLAPEGRNAAATLSSAESERRGDISSAMSTRLEDAHSALREAAHETARTVRDLAKITGRAAQLAEAKKR